MIAGFCFALFFIVLGSATSFYFFRYIPLADSVEECVEPLYFEFDEPGSDEKIRKPFWEIPDFSRDYSKTIDMSTYNFMEHLIPTYGITLAGKTEFDDTIERPF